ncbi:hypothetical protein [Niallia sp. FSL M8-0099]|uniref:hypothetical protein n=1 Tax=Niallia sp. FSL M8-0099 TaxID=2954519 RepID=UPI0030F673DD
MLTVVLWVVAIYLTIGLTITLALTFMYSRNNIELLGVVKFAVLWTYVLVIYAIIMLGYR